jgi:DNA-binding CsgD family transcriptional regulator
MPILTRREKEILELIAEGYTNSQIAGKIFLSQFTVDTHRKNLLAKLNVKNTASLIRLAVEQKLI